MNTDQGASLEIMAEINDSANSSVEHQHGSADQVTIDIPACEDYSEPKLASCIFRVPIDLRRINTEAYTPKVISIGPFHFGNKELIDMEKQKKRYIEIFSERKGKEKLVEMKIYIMSQAQNIRNCYYEQPSYKSKLLSSPESPDDKFVEMILYDAVFIIELFLRNHRKEVDFLLEKPHNRNNIKRDLQLLENQLPYFILNKLYDLAKSPEDDPPFLYVSCEFFRDDDFSRVYGSLSSKDVKHFVDLRRYFLIENHPTSKIQDIVVDLPTSNTEQKVVGLPCATMLDESGVRIRCVENPECLLDLKLESGFQLQIPVIMVNDWTEPLIRNVMALEQCYYSEETHVCNYIAFMDFLINTKKDADFLIEKGIIVNCLGEKAVTAKMSNGLCLQTSSPSSCYYDTAAIVSMLKNLSLRITLSSSVYYSMGEKLKLHYQRHICVRCWNRNMATLKKVYFRDIWTGTATVAAIILLVLTFIQAVCSILSLM